MHLAPGIGAGHEEHANAMAATRAAARGLRTAGIAFLLFVAYRVVFVYRFDLTGDCAPAAAGAAVNRETPRPAPRLRIVSYNIAGHTALVRGGHVAQVAALLRDLDADVVGLQEVHRGTWQSRFRDQVDELGRLTGLAAAFGPSYRALGGEFGNALLVRGEVLESATHPLPSVGEPRSLLRARVRVRGLELDVFVTHLAAWGGAARAVRARQLACLGAQLRSAERPFVLAGDLNAGPGAPEMAALLADEELARSCGAPGEATYPLLDRRIDYILVDQHWRVLEAQVLRHGPSDHWPVVASLTLAAAGATLGSGG
jgi:endonuclease/exonuclease/phosphatase family metal-dependent hydrolase